MSRTLAYEELRPDPGAARPDPIAPSACSEFPHHRDRPPLIAADEATRHHEGVGKIYGVYRTLGLLGQGGMGRVYLAEHIRLGRKVGLKVLHDHLLARPRMLERFFDEARVVAQVHNPHIVEILDLVATDEAAYSVMEYLPGKTLSQTLRLLGGPLPPDRVVHIARQVADALGAAHAVGVAHLDLKPANIFLTERQDDDDMVKLLDFGSGQAFARRDPDGSEDRTARLYGTPIYLSPEQAGGGPVDHRTDIYALGVVLYEMFTGRPPFQAASAAEYCYKHLRERPPRFGQLAPLPYTVPRRWQQAVMRCLEKDPASRFQAAADLSDRLASRSTTGGLQAVGLSRGRPSRMPRWAIISAVAFIGLAAVMARYGLHRLRGGGDQADGDRTVEARALGRPAQAQGEREPIGYGTSIRGGRTRAAGVGLTARTERSRVPGMSARSALRASITASVDDKTIEIRSVPSGAEVFDLGGCRRPYLAAPANATDSPCRAIGRTPLTLPRPSSANRRTILLRHELAGERIIRVPLGRNRTLETISEPRPAPRAGAMRADRPRSDRAARRPRGGLRTRPRPRSRAGRGRSASPSRRQRAPRAHQVDSTLNPFK